MNERVLRDCDSVHGYVGRVCFKNGPPGHVGAELEWLVAPRESPHRHVPIDLLEEIRSTASPPPGGSWITLEPGGQVELSSPVASNINACWHGLERDIEHLDGLLEQHGIDRLPLAMDPQRPPLRQVRNSRYDAMQEYFDRDGDTGFVMMTSTAAVQVNLDAGSDRGDVARRWALANAAGPTLQAAFANSPLHLGRRTGWKSTRRKFWQALDPRHTGAPSGSAQPSTDPAWSWAEYALAAPVMMVRRPDRWLPAPGFTFREWVNGSAGVGRPTEDDLAYHLTTLFPPVRPRGWYEVRYLDTQPHDLWPVPVAVMTALLDDPSARDRACEATEPVSGRWEQAARLGLDDPPLAYAATGCFEAALDALPRLGAEPALLGLVEQFVETYVSRRRSPADDLLTAGPTAGIAADAEGVR